MEGRQKIMSMDPTTIGQSLSAGALTVNVVGLGLMGLPTACLFAEAGANVIGSDIKAETVEKVNRGVSPIDEPGLQGLLAKHVVLGRLRATTDLSDAASKSDVIVVVVPTGISKNLKPDYSAVKEASASVGSGLSDGSIVIFCSTCAPGVTENIVKGVLEASSRLRAGRDFGLAYSPIRAMEGRVLEDLQSYPRVVGAIDERSLEVACAVLSAITKGGLLRVSSIASAEASKLFEAVYRYVNVALANELAAFCEALELDYFEIRDAANTQPYSHLLLPGAGVGGHSAPYPLFLMRAAKRLGVRLSLLGSALRINQGAPRRVLKLASDALRPCRKTLLGANITVLGVAYRANSRRLENSPALELIRLLKKRGAKVTAFDPKIGLREIEALGLRGAKDLLESCRGSDCLIVTTAHEEFRKMPIEEMARLTRMPAVIVDCSGLIDSRKATSVGFVYRGIGKELPRATRMRKPCYVAAA